MDFSVLGGDAIGLEDTPPEAWLAGASVTLPIGEKWRVSLEAMHGQIYGWDYYERRVVMVTPVIEREFLPRRRIRPYAAAGIGLILGFNQWPTGAQGELEWEWGPGFSIGGGGGVRLFLTKRLFVAPEVRVGLLPFLRSTVSVGYRF